MEESMVLPINPGVERFLTKLTEATGRVEAPYFQVQTASRDGYSVVYRERVYCYELYHQLREAMREEPGPYTLMGELDKHGHEIILGAKVPDFLFHVPGTMSGNLVVMEVKRIDNDDDAEISNDCAKLRMFVEDEAKYKGAIYLVFGSEGGNINRFRQLATEKLRGLRNGVFVLLWHKQVHECATKELCL
jgi:hypothetical protein